MKIIIVRILVFCTALSVVVLPIHAASKQSAEELIRQAHKHDNMYASDSESDQQKALRFYESALAEGPDEKQRLHIL